MNAALAPSDVRHHILLTAQRLMGQRGFTAVGLNEILKAAVVPKGSFYHYFESKEAFGKALLENYFADYQAHLQCLLPTPGRSAAERFMSYWQHWLETQASCDPQGKCLAVKLGAEVADLSDAMRIVLQQGTQAIIDRLADCIQQGLDDGSLRVDGTPQAVAETLYQLWLGASLLAKISRDRLPLQSAMRTTRELLHLPAA